MKRGIFIIIFLFLIPTIVNAFCGDKVIEENENCATCLEDNPCLVDYTCIEGQCVENMFPEISLFLEVDPDAKVIIPKDIATLLNSYFTEKVEFVACLKGKYSNGVYQVNELLEPTIVTQSEYAVDHLGCSRFSNVATIHSHLDGDCELSKVDLFTFGRKNDPLAGIVCGKNNFAFYSRGEFIKRMNYLIIDTPEYKKSKNLLYFLTFSTLTLIVLLSFIIYKRKLITKNRDRKLALLLLGSFNASERKIVNLLIETESLNEKNIPKQLINKMQKEGLIEVSNNIVKIKKWFRNALKSL